MKIAVADISEADYSRMRVLIPELPASFDGYRFERERRQRRLALTAHIEGIEREKITPETFARYSKARGIKHPNWEDLDRAALLQWQTEFPEHSNRVDRVRRSAGFLR
jgi:hypothetical protein